MDGVNQPQLPTVNEREGEHEPFPSQESAPITRPEKLTCALSNELFGDAILLLATTFLGGGFVIQRYCMMGEWESDRSFIVLIADLI
jgi:hypothetical protein